MLAPAAIAAPFVGYGVARAGFALADRVLRSLGSAAVDGDVETGPLFDAGFVHLFAVGAGAALLVAVLTAVFAGRQSTEAWRIGAEGERMTARALEKLPTSYQVVHDLPMPRSKANIDHVVVGPTGVFTVETKNYKNGMVIKGGQVFSGGRRMDRVVQQARRQAAAVAEQTGAAVTPIVCVHGAGVRLDGWTQKPVVDGVRFCSGGRLRKTIAGYAAELDDAAVRDVVGRLT